MPPAPLPVRDGLNPTRLRLPDSAEWSTILRYLTARFPEDTTRLREKVALGEVVTGDGTAITEDTPFASREFVFLYRDPPVEVPVPFAVDLTQKNRWNALVGLHANVAEHWTVEVEGGFGARSSASITAGWRF